MLKRTGILPMLPNGTTCTVEPRSLPAGVTEMHLSLFDGFNAGLEIDGGRAFSVQYHPEASPGLQDSMYLFERFVGMLEPSA